MLENACSLWSSSAKYKKRLQVNCRADTLITKNIKIIGQDSNRSVVWPFVSDLFVIRFHFLHRYTIGMSDPFAILVVSV